MLVGIITTSGWNAPPPPTDASGEQQWEYKAYCFPCYVMGVKSTFGNSGPDSGFYNWKGALEKSKGFAKRIGAPGSEHNIAILWKGLYM